MAVSKLIKNENVYASVAQADTYMGDSVRGTNWEFLDDDSKARALITATRIFQKQNWQGTLDPIRTVKTAAVSAAGTGYAVGEVLTVSGGTGGAATATVLTLSGSAVATIQLTDAGLYTVEPTSPATTTASASGTGCTLTLTFQDQQLHFPAIGLTLKDGASVSAATVPQQIIDGHIELAFEVSQDSEFETSGGTGSNNKKLVAGSASIEFFRPTGGADGTGSARFPPAILELVGQFLQGGRTAPTATGTTVESAFDDCDRQGLLEGFA